MRYPIIWNYKSSSINCQKFVLNSEKWNFEPIENSVHTPVTLAWGKALDIYVDYLMSYPSRQHVQWKHFKCKYISNDEFMMNRELNLCKA